MWLPSVVSTSLLAPRGLFVREDVVTTIVTTLAEESTTFVVIDGQTEETVVSGTPSIIEIGAVETTLDIYPLFTHTMADATTISVEIEPQALKVGGSKFTGKLNGTPFTEKIPFTTAWTYPGTTLELSFPARQIEFILSDAVSTEITLPPEQTHVTIDGIETAVDLPGLTTTLIASDSTNIVIDLPAVTTTKEIYPETFEFTVHADLIDGGNGIKFCGTDNAQILTEQWGPGIGGPCIPGTTFAVTIPSQRRDLFLRADGLATTFTLLGVTTTFVPEQAITIVKDGSTEASVIPAVVSSYVTTISDTTVPSSEEPSTEFAAGPVTTTVTEPDSAVSSGMSQSVLTTDINVLITTSNSDVILPRGIKSIMTPPASSLNTACSVVLGPMSGEDVALLEVIFSGTIDGTTYAQWLVNYASQLTRQIDNVAAQALADSGRQYTTAFNSIDVTGILGLASAAPMYTCYLSSLWAEALRNPSAYAKRDIPTQDEKTKLIVLFERRNDNNGNYDLAELLVDETDDLISEMYAVICGQVANPSNYANLFTRLDVRRLLSLASVAPVYTQGLSAAMETARASYFATATDRVTTIVTDIVSGSSTYRTTIVSTLGQAAPAQTTTVVNEPAANAPVNKVTTEVVTLGNGRVETRTVTICVENCDTVVAQSTRRPAAVQTITTRPNVAVYTQVQNGVTYTHAIEIQTKNVALGGAALLL